jgi:hypothetical protein
MAKQSKPIGMIPHSLSNYILGCGIQEYACILIVKND